MLRRFIFASESVGEGHPDKVCDTISDAVLDACLRTDKKSRVACETYAKSNVVVVGGEITTKAKLDYVQIVREAVREKNERTMRDRMVFLSAQLSARHLQENLALDATTGDGLA